MAKWTAFAHAGDYSFDATSAKKHWARLHQGDCEPLPKDAVVLAAWVLFHNGEFQKAFDAGIKAGDAGLLGGITVANKAACIYANYLETKEKTKLEMFMEAAERAEALQKTDPNNANAYYWQAYGLGRYGQGISVAKALAQGLGSKIKQALEHAIKLQPRHADAHIALAAFHAEVIDKVGSLIGGMTYGAKKDVGLSLFKKALELNPTSAIAMVEQANGMVMLEGDKKMKEATQLYQQAAASKALDACERLDVEMAKTELED
jgi:tetratricopeptide (TPR) repeat protein